MKTKYIIGTIVVLVFIVWGASAFLKTTVRYVSFAEARIATRTVQVVGKIDLDDVLYDAEKKRLVFSIYDPENKNPVTAERMKVIYYGVVPGNFEQATLVVVRGKPDNEAFKADRLLVKCPSKYEGLLTESER